MVEVAGGQGHLEGLLAHNVPHVQPVALGICSSQRQAMGLGPLGAEKQKRYFWVP